MAQSSGLFLHLTSPAGRNGRHTTHGPLRHCNHGTYSTVIPAKAGIQGFPSRTNGQAWIPAFAGMTLKEVPPPWETGKVLKVSAYAPSRG
ncbi:protein of unknown function [Azospirillum lipoferum 4B]|uniref:Uncharacterized protein n=1 Tax=Azospirillum lipoferum (strain 4B) TaxID=862719 RepID=G7Z4V5_AZOL4|nr:protein of unknown function [Azospirillum lipoferum 4B]